MPIIISSKDNERVKYTKSLLKNKNRQKESKFIIEGYRILTLAIECNADLDYVFINETFENKDEHKIELKLTSAQTNQIIKVVAPMLEQAFSDISKEIKEQLTADESE